MPVSARSALSKNVDSAEVWGDQDNGRALHGYSRLYHWLGNMALALMVVGFPVVAGISQIVGAQSNAISVAYRIIFLVLCTPLLLLTLKRGSYRIDYLIFFFFMACVARLTGEYFYGPFIRVDDDFRFYVVTVLLPVLCLAGGRDWYQERLSALLIVAIGSIANLIAIYALQTDILLLREADLGLVDRSSLSTLDPISLGYNGLFTGAAALLLVAQRPGWRWNPLILLAIVPAAYVLVATSSRGPIVALMVSMAVIGLANRRAGVAAMVVAVAGLAAVAYLGAPEGIINRFSGIGYDASSSERLNAVWLATEEAMDNPFFGYAYIEPVTGIHPHNMLAESGMALGLGGAVLMAWMQLSMLGRSFKAAAKQDVVLAFIAIAQLVNAWISGSIWESAMFFMALWLIRDQRHLGDTRNVALTSSNP